MKHRSLSILITLTIPFALACGSIDLGSLGDILGSTGPNDRSDIQGEVTNIDTRAMRIDLDVDYVNNLRDRRSNSSVYYDSNTVVEYDGNTYAVTDLERGDRVRISGFNDDGRYIARTITVTRNVRDTY